MECTPLLTDLWRNHPNLTLGSTWCTQFSCDVVTGNPFANVIVFFAADDYILEDVTEYIQEPVHLTTWGATDVPDVNSTSPTVAPSTTRYKDGVLLVAVTIPKKIVDLDKLVEAGTINTLWGIPIDQDYYLNFTKDGHGNYYVQGLGNEQPVRIIDKQEACNGVLYVTDRLLKPAKYWSEIPQTFNTTQDAVAIRETVAELALCNDTLISATGLGASGDQIYSAWMATSLYDALDTIDLAVTLLLPGDLFTDRYRREWIAAEAKKGKVTEAELSAWVALYQMLPGVYCDAELLEERQMETMLGKLVAASGGNASFPIKFGPGIQNKNVRYIGQIGPIPSYEVANTIDTKTACNSRIQIIDGTPLPDYEGHIKALRSIDLEALPELLQQQSLSPRFMTCNPAAFVKGNSNADGSKSDDDISSSSTALAIGLGVGIGCAALVAAAAAFVVVKKKRNGGNTQQKGRHLVSPFAAASHNDIGLHYDPELGALGSNTRCKGSIDSSFKLPIPDRSEWEISLDRIQFLKHKNGSDWILGRGNWGVVQRALLDSKQPVAVKSIPVSPVAALESSMSTNSGSGSTINAPAMKESFLQEMAMLKFLSKDPHIVRLHGAVLDSDNYMLVVECMEGGDLREALNHDQAGAMRWYGQGRGVAIDCALGLAFLHSNNIVHRDIKSKNILLDSNNRAKLADVGLARMREGEEYFSDGITGTFAWSAPELLLNQRCTEKVDVYSFGVVLWELCTGEKPVRGGMRSLSVPEDCPHHIADIIMACLDTDPANRPTVKEILVILNDNKKMVVTNHNDLKGAAFKSPVQETKQALESFNAFGGSN